MKKRNALNHVLVLLAASAPMLLGTGCSENARLEQLAVELTDCDDGAEIPSKYYCDKIVDCRDGSDEYSCYDFECRGVDGETVYYSGRCDGYEDCSNGNDEEDCSRSPYFSGESQNNGVTNNGEFNSSNNNLYNNGEYGSDVPAAGEIGSACEYTGDCPGMCLTSQGSETPRRYYEGYCSAPCSADYDCAEGSHCSVTRECFDGCDDNSDCRGTGYSCQDADQDGRRECYGSATGATPFGEGCSSYTDCSGGDKGTCVTGQYSGGYCTLLCADDESSCPYGSVCVPGSSGLPYCLVQCDLPEDCRTGTCQDYNGYRVCIP